MRILLKISGEVLAGNNLGGFDFKMLEQISTMIEELVNEKIEIGIVIGAGNFIRGAEIEKNKIDRCNADNMGMLAININTIALGDVLARKGLKVKTFNSFEIDGVVAKFNKKKALHGLKEGHVVIFAGGTGNPYFTTDTAGVLRALEIEADLMIKATKVDGVYDKDPIKHKDAKFYKNIKYNDLITKNLRVMDSTAIALAKNNDLILKVVNLYKKGAILKAILGEDEGTTIS